MNIINGFGGKSGYDSPAVNNKNTGQPTAESGESTASESPSEDGGVNLSSGAAAMKQLTQTLSSTPSFDQSKVDQIKNLIANGQYNVDPQKIAQKFMAMERTGS